MAISRTTMLNDEARYDEALVEWDKRCEAEGIPKEKRSRPDLVLVDGRKAPKNKQPAPSSFADVIAKAKALDAVAWRLIVNGVYLASGRIPT